MQTTLLEPGLRLTICGISELDSHATAGVTHVLSILDPGTPEPAAFAAYDPHHRLTMRFHDIIGRWPGWQAPEREDVEALIGFGADLDRAGPSLKHLLVHCHAGISRSTAALVTLLARHTPLGEEPAIFERIHAIRSQAWPNSRMIGFADDLLERGGRLNAALVDLYRRQAVARPDFLEELRRLGRGEEIPT
ncbi:MAG: protein-tyrosine phosphatase family protein [Geminicoccaceae bacterium]